ncbi:MAG: DUF4159 domain-containing protein, partial [Lentisphaeria bacterium]|nr:DUF4159 domain-containing protein [Lentisphaeria bacterium]
QFADRNSNKITIERRDDGRTNVKMTLFDISAEQQEMIDSLDAMIKAAQPQTDPNDPEAEPTDVDFESVVPDEQLEIVSELSGIAEEDFAGASRIILKQVPRLLHLEIRVENTMNSSFQTFHVKLENPTEEQLTAVTRLFPAISDLPQELEPLLDALNNLKEREIPSDLVPVMTELFNAPNRSEDSSLSLNQPKICRNMIRAWETPSITYLWVMNADEYDLNVSQDANVEIAFDQHNTEFVKGLSQYTALGRADTATTVTRNLKEINDRLQKLADRQNKVAMDELKLEAENTIRNHPDKRKLTEVGKRNIREGILKKFVKVEPKFRKLESIKLSEINEWYQKDLKRAKVNADNLRYSVEIMEIIHQNDLTAPAERYTVTLGTIVLIILLIGFAASIVSRFLPKFGKICFYTIAAATVVFALYWFGFLNSMCDFPDQVLDTVGKKELFSSDMRNEIWLQNFWYWLPGMIFALILALPLLTASVRQYFGFRNATDSIVIETLACKTESRSFVRSFYWVTWYHFFFLLILPILVGLMSSVEEDAYYIPGGGGDVAPQQIVVQKKKKVKKKKYILNPNSAIIFDVPEINDQEHLMEIDDATATQYVTGSGMGKGKKTGKPGWAGGMEDAKIRFIRLEYRGSNWDWNMGKGADYNMLIFLKQQGFNIAPDTESTSIDKLARGFRKGNKPPFVYLTGRGSINLSATEVKQLREYLLNDNGMIFADNAGGSFDHNFKAMLRRVLPNHKLVDIANDDPIYRAPFLFPNGAPAFFHHSGTRALGIKNNGRWMVFYHQGDIGDAWKGAGLTEQQRAEAFKMGANVISYAFGAYLENLEGGKK